MKLSNKQAELLAKEIHSRLLAANVQTVSLHLKNRIELFKKERDELIERKNEADAAIDRHDEKLKKIVGNQVSKIRSYWDADNIIQKLEELNMPSLSDIEGKIVLKAMFISAEEMENFVNELVKEFSKKKTAKASSN